MEVLESLRGKLDITTEEYKEIEKIIRTMETNINIKGIYFNDQLKVGFYSHMVSFIRRLKNNELIVDANEESIVEQIKKENMDLAIELIKPLFQKYKVKDSYSEIVLIAIYIQTASQNE
jgi:transcriptional regulatory protein LevR